MRLTSLKNAPDFKQFVIEIVDEHYQITKGNDSNLNYLWYMYKSGTNDGNYKPFIFMAEMQLLKEMGYMSQEQIEAMCDMMGSEDEDNLNIAYLALKNFKGQRLKDHGIYTKTNFAYTGVEKDYPVKILNHSMFLNTVKTQ